MKIITLKEVDSTNEYLKREYQRLPVHACVIAQRQTAGKGRRGHIWQSQDYQNMTVSFLYKDIHDIQDCWKYTLIAAKSVVEFLKAEGIQSTIKWPNDIYVYDLKICGILVETILDPDLKGIIVGIGLNVNHAYPYLCMKDITQKRYDISQLLLQLIHFFNKNIELYQNHQFDDILKYTNLHAYLKNKWVHYKNYGFVRFIKVTQQGLIEFEDRNHHVYQEMINEISLARS